MKRAMIVGDMIADATDEQYPTVTLCDACIEKDGAKKEDGMILSVAEDAVPEDGPCEWCNAE